jgi:hypothetical protein
MKNNQNIDKVIECGIKMPAVRYSESGFVEGDQKILYHIAINHTRTHQRTCRVCGHILNNNGEFRDHLANIHG